MNLEILVLYLCSKANALYLSKEKIESLYKHDKEKVSGNISVVSAG